MCASKFTHKKVAGGFFKGMLHPDLKPSWKNFLKCNSCISFIKSGAHLCLKCDTAAKRTYLKVYCISFSLKLSSWPRPPAHAPRRQSIYFSPSSSMATLFFSCSEQKLWNDLHSSHSHTLNLDGTKHDPRSTTSHHPPCHHLSPGHYHLQPATLKCAPIVSASNFALLSAYIPYSLIVLLISLPGTKSLKWCASSLPLLYHLLLNSHSLALLQVHDF